MKPIVPFYVDQLTAPEPAPIGSFNIQLLAQGDSWFSFGAVPPWDTTNLLFGMATSVTEACVVNCARPGKELGLMTDRVWERKFRNQLKGRMARPWSGILVSGGGNDLIAAIQSSPQAPQDRRLLLAPAEWTQAPGAAKYLSNAGWDTFSRHITEVVGQLLQLRDSGPSKGVPVIMHTYDLAVPRPAPALHGVSGPWLHKAVTMYGIPPADWVELARLLLDRLQTLLSHIAATTPDGSLHVVRSQGTLRPARITDTGPTDDWENEIHPTAGGYGKLAALWRPMLDAVFDAANTRGVSYANLDALTAAALLAPVTGSAVDQAERAVGAALLSRASGSSASPTPGHR